MFGKKKWLQILIFSKKKEVVLNSEAPDMYSGPNITSPSEADRREIKTEGIFELYEKQKSTWDCLGMEPVMWPWVTHLGAKRKTVPFDVGAAEPAF